MWRWILRPLLFCFDPERVHYAAMAVFSLAMLVPPIAWVVRALWTPRDPRLRTSLLGIELSSPVGLAAGFDKDARWFNLLGDLGFGFVEVGTLTGQAQPGNPAPRLFRLPADRAIINRFGFNNQGSADAASRLATTPARTVLGINIGKTKLVPNEEANADYLASLERLWPYARYVVVNVSSPNTQGLRDLQQRDALRSLLQAVVDRNRSLAVAAARPPHPVLVKIAPDLDGEGMQDVIDTVLDVGLDGIVATNTTLAREPLVTPSAEVEAIGAGGLSGAPLTQRSRAFVADLYRRSGGRIPIIGVGGIMGPDDAIEMLRSGASAVQVYTGFIYGGPAFAAQLNAGIARYLAGRGLDRVGQIVGEAAR